MFPLCVCDINVSVASWGHWAGHIGGGHSRDVDNFPAHAPRQSTGGAAVWGPAAGRRQPRVRVSLVFRRTPARGHFYFHPLLKTSSYGIHQSCHSQLRDITYSSFHTLYMLMNATSRFNI